MFVCCWFLFFFIYIHFFQFFFYEYKQKVLCEGVSMGSSKNKGLTPCVFLEDADITCVRSRYKLSFSFCFAFG